MTSPAPSRRERIRAETQARLRERRQRHLERNIAVRALWAIAGAIVALAGVAMLVLPGPAIVVIPVGLAMLALEFAWAERPLVAVLEQADRAKEVAGGPSRRTVLVAVAVALLCLAGLGLAYRLGAIPQSILDLVPVIELTQRP
jgi:uncharacterized protein (TIGR02611 family)